ncbi:MAG: DUF3108 domain-containing protein [Candidatus Krumholzibacteriia bacterium]
MSWNRHRLATLVVPLLLGLGQPAQPQPATPVTETLNYRIRVGPMTAGQATIAARPVALADGPPAVEIRLSVRSSGLLSRLYPVRDRITSWAAQDDLRTLLLDRRIREGRRRLVDHWRVDHARRTARERGGARVPVPAGVHDILSALWRLRTADLAAADTLSLPLLLGSRTARMFVAAGSATDVEVPAGRFRCVPLCPRLGEPAEFDGGSPVLIECSLGPQRWPVRLRLPLPVVGSVSVELETASVGNGGEIREDGGKTVE